MVDVAAKEARPFAKLGIQFDDVKLSPDGTRLYMFAYGFNLYSGLPEGDPALLEVDADTGEVTRRLELPDVTIGQREEQGGSAGVQYAMYFPARVMSPDGRRYYVAHADSETVTVINLEAMSIESSAEPKRPTSVWGSIGGFLGGLLVSEAEAKGGLYRSKQALLSPDGQVLYVTGSYSGYPEDDPEGKFPLGLKAIDARTMTIMWEEEGVDSIALSLNGGTVYAVGFSSEWSEATANEYWPINYVGIGVKALGARDGEVIAHINPDAVYDRLLLTPDGQHLLAFTDTSYGMTIEERRDLNLEYVPDLRVAIVDTQTLSVAREVALGRFSAEFVGVP